MQQQISRGQQLLAEEGLGDTLQQDLQSLESTLSKMEQSMDSQEQGLEVPHVLCLCLSLSLCLCLSLSVSLSVSLRVLSFFHSFFHLCKGVLVVMIMSFRTL